jgi:hypothetical protein
MRNTGQKYYFLSTSYPASMYDLMNTRDKLITTFYGKSVHIAVVDAQAWLDKNVNKEPSAPVTPVTPTLSY